MPEPTIGWVINFTNCIKQPYKWQAGGHNTPDRLFRWELKRFKDLLSFDKVLVEFN